MVSMASDPQKYNFCLTQYLMERLDTRHIDWLRSLPLLDKIEVDGLRFIVITPDRTMVELCR